MRRHFNARLHHGDHGLGRQGGWEPYWGGGRRMRRGDIRTALLAELADSPGHGYELMTRLEERTEGSWRPSPGSVYPTLQLLEDEGLVRSEERDGKRVYELTEGGRAEAAARTEAAGGAPWESATDEVGLASLRTTLFDLRIAARQVAHAGSAEVVKRSIEILRDARKQLYRLLADT